MESKSKDYYNSLYEQILSRSSNPGKASRYIARVVALHVLGSVLDIGCGISDLSNRVSGHYLGVDFSSVAINEAERICRNIHAKFVCSDIFDLDIDSMSYDTVVMSEVVEHVDDPLALYSLARRIARIRVVLTLPINMHGRSHVTPEWGKGDIENLCRKDNLLHCEQFGIDGKDTWWIVCVEVAKKRCEN